MCLPASLANKTAAPLRSSWSPMRRKGAPAASLSTPTASSVPFVIFHRTLAGMVGNHLHIAYATSKAGNRSDINDSAVFVRNHRQFSDPLAEQKQRPDVEIH